MRFGQKSYCKVCGILLHGNSILGAITGEKPNADNKSFEFADGTYCRRCAEQRMKQAQKENEKSRKKSWFAF